MSFPIHPLSEIFPLMAKHEYDALKADIDKNGLQCPILLYQGKILDGRNRYNACLDTGTEPKFDHYKGRNPEAYVLSVNINRRQLTKAQASLVAARIADKPEGRPGKNSANLYSLEEAADLLRVSRRNVAAAKDFLAKADPALVKLVEEAGSKLSLDAAYLVSDLVVVEQQELASQGVKAVKVKAAELRNPPPPQDQRLLVSGPSSIVELKSNIIGKIQQMRQSAFVDTTSTAALDAVIAECEKLKREISNRGVNSRV
jgi:hypothetical protein